MAQILVKEMADSFTKTIGLLRESIENCDDDAWRKGLTFFQVPAKVAYHDVECLGFYFRPKGAGPYTWGQRFGKPWWELSNEDQPSREELVAYLDEVEEQIAGHLDQVQDEALGEIYDPEADHGRTALGHYLYALRHTVHHLGSLVSLAAGLGAKPGEWHNWM
jgi:uncharacterized damage-inducible protein DinB